MMSRLNSMTHHLGKSHHHRRMTAPSQHRKESHMSASQIIAPNSPTSKSKRSHHQVYHKSWLFLKVVELHHDKAISRRPYLRKMSSKTKGTLECLTLKVVHQVHKRVVVVLVAQEVAHLSVIMKTMKMQTTFCVRVWESVIPLMTHWIRSWINPKDLKR